MLKRRLPKNITIFIASSKNSRIGKPKYCHYCRRILIIGDKIVSKMGSKKTKYYHYECAKLVRVI